MGVASVALPSELSLTLNLTAYMRSALPLRFKALSFYPRYLTQYIFVPTTYFNVIKFKVKRRLQNTLERYFISLLLCISDKWLFIQLLQSSNSKNNHQTLKLKHVNHTKCFYFKPLTVLLGSYKGWH